MSSHVLKIAPDSFAARLLTLVRIFRETQIQVLRRVPKARGFAILIPE